MDPAFGEIYNLITLSGIVLLIPWLAQALVPACSSSVGTNPVARDANGRYMIFDVLKGIAIIAVIVIHVCYFLLPNTLGVSEALLHAINAIMRFAIPVFLITSGVLLTPPQHTAQALKKFYADKFFRIVVPYLLVCLAFAPFVNLAPSQFIHAIFVGTTIAVPFYFVIVLFQLYLIYPLIEPFARDRRFVYATLALTLFTQVLPFYWTIGGVHTFFQYLFFFVWGIYMRPQLLERGIALRDLAPWLVMIGLFFVLYAMFPGEYYNIRPYYGPAIFMVFFALFSRVASHHAVVQGLANVGRNSLWIFLLHFPIMQGIFLYATSQETLTGAPFLVLAVIVSIVASIAVAFIVARGYALVALFIKKQFARVRV